jgi:hypothetical protein
MYIPATTITLALLTIAMVLLRTFWSRLPPRLKSILIRASIVMIVLHGLFVATKWATTSDLLNVIINWLAIASYELLIVLFSRLSPRWLTIPSAAILLIPLFSSSILSPLARLFALDPHPKVSLHDHLFYVVSPWSNVGGGTAGVDVSVYYRPPFAPFLCHKLQTIPFNDQECNSRAATAKAFPAEKTVLGRCPYWHSQSGETLDKLLPLR